MKKSISSDNNYMKNISSNDLLKDEILNKNLKLSREIKSILYEGKRVRFDFLGKNKEPKPINFHNIKNLKQRDLICKFNAFQKIYFNVNKEHKDYESQYYPLKKQNDYFSEKLKKIHQRNHFQEVFSELKEKYYKKGMKNFPSLTSNHNIFTNDILLLNQSDLERYIIYGDGKKTNLMKSLNYLSKIREKIFIKRNNELRKNYSTNNIYDEIGIRNYNIKERKKKRIKSFEKEIKHVAHELSLIKKTFNNLNNLDNIDNSHPLSSRSSLRQFSKINDNTRPNSGNDNLELFSNIFDKDIKKKKNYEIIKKEKEQNKQDKSILVEKIFIPNTERKKINIKGVSPLENLYSKVSKIEDAVKNHKKIEEFLFANNYKIKSITPKSIYFQVEKVKDKLLEKNYVEQNIDLRKEKGKQLDLSKRQSLCYYKEKLINNEINDFSERSMSYLYNFEKNVEL